MTVVVSTMVDMMDQENNVQDLLRFLFYWGDVSDCIQAIVEIRLMLWTSL